jgi:competence protein ComEC
MGFAAEKEKTEKRVRKYKIVALIVGVCILAALAVFGLFVQPLGWKYYVALPSVTKRGTGELRIHYVSVGQGDATLVELPDGKVMLIDGGDGTEEANSALLRYINALKIETIDYLVATHADVDHCGGLSEVLAFKQVKRAFVPTVSLDGKEDTADYKAYKAFYAALQKEGCSQEFSRRELTLTSENASFPYTIAFLYPHTAEPAIDRPSNDDSCVIWLDYHGASALFTGDISANVERAIMEEYKNGLGRKDIDVTDTEILKVSHHGSENATEKTFVEYLGVETAVISCGKHNAYNHPSLTVLQTLLACNVQTYRTDIHGNVMLTLKQDGTYSVAKSA